MFFFFAKKFPCFPRLIMNIQHRVDQNLRHMPIITKCSNLYVATVLGPHLSGYWDYFDKKIKSTSSS